MNRTHSTLLVQGIITCLHMRLKTRETYNIACRRKKWHWTKCEKSDLGSDVASARKKYHLWRNSERSEKAAPSAKQGLYSLQLYFILLRGPYLSLYFPCYSIGWKVRKLWSTSCGYHTLLHFWRLAVLDVFCKACLTLLSFVPSLVVLYHFRLGVFGLCLTSLCHFFDCLIVSLIWGRTNCAW